MRQRLLVIAALPGACRFKTLSDGGGYVFRYQAEACWRVARGVSYSGKGLSLFSFSLSFLFFFKGFRPWGGSSLEESNEI